MNSPSSKLQMTSPRSKFLSPSSKMQSLSTFSNLMPLKNKKIRKIYNSITNIYDSQEINQGLESLGTVREKVNLVDFVISRREEIKKAEEIEKLNKLTPLINKMKRNYLAKSLLRKRSEDLEKLSDNSASIRNMGSGIAHYRRFSLKGNILMPEEKKSVRIQPSLPKIEENIPRKDSSIDQIKSQNSDQQKHSFGSIPSISVIKPVEKIQSPASSQKRRASMLTVITMFNQTETDKKLKVPNSMPRDQKQRNSFIKNQQKKEVNSKIYNTDFHLIPLESPNINESHMKKYELPSSILKKSTYKPPLDNKKIDGVLEKELLKFMTKNKETINLNFLNLEKLKRHKNIATIESKVKGKLKDLLIQEKINNAQKKYYFRDTFLHRLRESCTKCLKKHDKPPEIHQKSSSTVKKNMNIKKHNFKSLELTKVPSSRF